MEEGDEVWDGVEGWVNVDGWCNVVGGGRVETWETTREGMDGWDGWGARWKCGGGWEAKDGWNRVGRDAGKGTCMPRATLGINGGKKEVSGEIVTPTCLCTWTCIHIHGLIY